SGPPSASICSSLGARTSHRWRHVCTVPRLRRIWRVTSHWLAPVSSAKRILARRTSRWGLVCRRASCSKQARCRAVSCTLGETVGAGAMAVGIRNSFRENWALFSSYDTMPPSVRILLPSTTSLHDAIATLWELSASRQRETLGVLGGKIIVRTEMVSALLAD